MVLLVSRETRFQRLVSKVLYGSSINVSRETVPKSGYFQPESK